MVHDVVRFTVVVVTAKRKKKKKSGKNSAAAGEDGSGDVNTGDAPTTSANDISSKCHHDTNSQCTHMKMKGSAFAFSALTLLVGVRMSI